jgi:hypothetical protein
MIAQCKAEKARDGARKSERLKIRRGLEAGKFEARGRIKLNRACHEQRVAVTRLAAIRSHIDSDEERM